MWRCGASIRSFNQQKFQLYPHVPSPWESRVHSTAQAYVRTYIDHIPGTIYSCQGYQTHLLSTNSTGSLADWDASLMWCTPCQCRWQTCLLQRGSELEKYLHTPTQESHDVFSWGWCNVYYHMSPHHTHTHTHTHTHARTHARTLLVHYGIMKATTVHKLLIPSFTWASELKMLEVSPQQ